MAQADDVPDIVDVDGCAEHVARQCAEILDRPSRRRFLPDHGMAFGVSGDGDSRRVACASVVDAVCSSAARARQSTEVFYDPITAGIRPDDSPPLPGRVVALAGHLTVIVDFQCHTVVPAQRTEIDHGSGRRPDECAEEAGGGCAPADDLHRRWIAVDVVDAEGIAELTAEGPEIDDVAAGSCGSNGLLRHDQRRRHGCRRKYLAFHMSSPSSARGHVTFSTFTPANDGCDSLRTRSAPGCPSVVRVDAPLSLCMWFERVERDGAASAQDPADCAALARLSGVE